MPMALQTQRDEVTISKANGWRMVSSTMTTRETATDPTPCLHNYPKNLGFVEKKGQLREWTTVATL
jgi:hypothetical protein